MSDFKTVFKSGWHPKGKDGGKESWRGDYKGINQVAGWMGKGKTSGDGPENTHVSRPLASLKDPSAFGPPPKNVNYHGGAALPNEITPHRSGLGAPLTQQQIASARQATASPTALQEDGVTEVQAAPSLPYRADRTGLRTDNLPPPPTHRDVQRIEPAPSQQSPKPTPSLPPRLPSRQNTATPPPPSYASTTGSNDTKPSAHKPVRTTTPTLNQSAINRLGNAGVSVPALGISSRTNKPTNTTSTEQIQDNSNKMNELQSRFSKMNTSFSGANKTNKITSPTETPPNAALPQPQAQAPSWQQTQAALKTANSFHKDPTSVSLADAQSAAQTAQSAQQSAAVFRERHSTTINAAQTRATQLNKKYNMTGRLNKFLEDANTAHDNQAQQTPTTGTQQQALPVPQQQQLQSPPSLQQQHPSPWATPNQPPVSTPIVQPQAAELAASISRKPPPPPPPKKPASMQAPPPVPLGTKPSLG